MPRVNFVKSARKARPECGVEVGDSYYHWSHRTSYGGIKRCSKMRPGPAQLTRSEFWGQAYGLQDEIASESPETAEELVSAREGWVDQIRSLGEEQDEKLNNMPQGLQESDTGYLLGERRDACGEWADALESVEIPGRDSYDADADGEEVFREDLETALREMADLGPECN